MVSDYLRLKSKEIKALSKIAKELNFQRLKNDQAALKESEILHKIIEQAFQNISINDAEISLSKLLLQTNNSVENNK